MLRQSRHDLPGVNQHLVKKGNGRQPCFHSRSDSLRYLQDLREGWLRHAVALHAYVLMTNHVHPLFTPLEPGADSRMMQFLGRDYASYSNRSYHRTVTLWE